MTISKCLYDMSRAIRATALADKYGPLPMQQRACISANLFEHCIDVGLYEFLAVRSSLAPQDESEIAETLNSAADEAQIYKRKQCKGVRLTKVAKAIRDAAVEAFGSLKEVKRP